MNKVDFGRRASPSVATAFIALFWLGAGTAMGGTSPNQSNREPAAAQRSNPPLPGSRLPEQLPTEPHNAGKRSWMKAGMNNLRQATLLREYNRNQPDVVTLPDNLQYRVRVEGNGPKPKKNDTVEVFFTGTLMDGTVFASAASGGKPAVFNLNEVIPGWQEALKMMPVGSKWQLFVPPELGYGAQGLPPDVGPDALLTYELELVGIKPRAPKKPKANPATDSSADPAAAKPAAAGE